MQSSTGAIITSGGAPIVKREKRDKEAVKKANNE